MGLIRPGANALVVIMGLCQPSATILLFAMITACSFAAVDQGACDALLDSGHTVLREHSGSAEPCCKSLVDDFQLRGHGGSAQPDPSKMLFFLHIPRTAGRTFHSCFLKLAHPPSKRCAKSYDVLRLNVSMGSCGLLSSHDDYSATDYLPAEAAIITQLRDPVSRMISAYEFAVEVAARVLTRPKNYTADPTKTNTRDVWPWSKLVPLIEQDMLQRVAVERSRNATGTPVEPGEPINPFNNSLIMPLADFVMHPVVDDTLGNGQAMQVLGLTSYSHWPEAAQLRECVRKHPDSQQQLQRLAEDHIRAMLHVGLMEELHLSMASLASTLGIKLNGSTWKPVTANAFSYEDDQAKQESQEVEAARARLQNLTLALHSKKRELVDASKRWQDQRAALQAQQPGVQDGKDARKSEQPDWLTTVQDQYKQLQEEVRAVSQEAHIVHGHEARGRAQQILPDDNFRSVTTVRDAFFECSQLAQQRNRQRKANSLRGLVTADGQQVQFSSEARRNINEHVVELIRERNAMDTALVRLGKMLLNSRVGQQHLNGTLEHMHEGRHARPNRARYRDRMPPPPPPPAVTAVPTAPASAVVGGRGAVTDEL